MFVESAVTSDVSPEIGVSELLVIILADVEDAGTVSLYLKSPSK